MTQDELITILFSYVFLNVVLFIIYQFTDKYKTIHRILSTLDNILFVLILGYFFYQVNHLFVIIIPCILLLIYPISWGLNRELSDEDAASVVKMNSPFPTNHENRIKTGAAFAHFLTFPFYYLLDSWQKA